MKKILPVLIPAVMLMAGCSTETISTITTVNVTVNTPSEAWMKAAARAAADGLRNYARDEELMALYTPTESVSSIIDEWSEAEVDTSMDIIRIRISEESISDYSALGIAGVDSLSELDDAAKRYVEMNYSQSFINMLNASAGVEELAASAIVKYSKSYVVDTAVTNQTWLLECDSDLAVGVSFTNTGDNVITVSATYISSMHELETLFDSLMPATEAQADGDSGVEPEVDTLKW